MVSNTTNCKKKKKVEKFVISITLLNYLSPYMVIYITIASKSGKVLFTILYN